MTNDRRRVGVVVQPVVLAGALAKVLLEIGRYEVIAASELDTTSVDALVADYGGGQDLVADLVIELPAEGGPWGAGRVWTKDGVFDEPVVGAMSILELIDRYCP